MYIVELRGYMQGMYGETTYIVEGCERDTLREAKRYLMELAREYDLNECVTPLRNIKASNLTVDRHRANDYYFSYIQKR